MSMHHSHAHRQARATHLCVHVSVLASILLTTMLLFLLTTSPTLASSTRSHISQTNPPENLARVGVSVVRLVSYYKSTTSLSTQSDIACTGLGIIIKSSNATNSSDQNSWVLTDGSLVNPTQATCATQAAFAALQSISILMSNAYNPQSIPFATASVATTGPVVLCQQIGACNNGLALFSFHSDQPLPYADLATTDTTQTTAIGLIQRSTATALPPASATSNQTRFYLQKVTPYSTPVITQNTKLEAGTPFVNAVGEITGMTLIAQKTPSVKTMQDFLNTQDALKTFSDAHSTNLVHDNWKNGIAALYQNPPATQAANEDFKQAFAENPQFVGAQNFAQLTSAPTNGESGKHTTPTGNSFLPANITLFDFTLPIIPLLVSAFIVLLALIFLMTRLFSKSAHRRQFESDLAAARQIAKNQQPGSTSGPLPNQFAPQANSRPITTQAIMPAMPMPPAPPEQEAPTLPINNSGILANPRQELHCPNCGYNVAPGVIYCPNCNIMLSPSDSGLHLRSAQPMQQFSPSMPPLAPRPPLIENQPTLEFPFDATPYNGNNSVHQNYPTDAERTMPNLPKPLEEATTQPVTYSGKRPVVSPIIGFEVAPRTNRGIKRKHKANEDSVFAAQGACFINGSQCQVGLFIVADGMGGHANGQDASRLAIQAVRETIMTRLFSSMEMNKETLRQVLVDGVRKANQAINERNIEQHADMGTTMTGTLIIGMPTTEVGEDGQMITYPAIACVINVGDSRTYRYRLSDGLKKLTQDHSVVASLVAAGIIQEDDIYTHPRRNQIYRSLGEKLDIEIDAFIVPLLLGDRLLVCSDGLWDMVRDPKIEEVIRTNLNNVNKMSEALIQAALDGGGEDNVSVIVIHLPEDAIRPSPHPLQEMEIVGRDKE